MLQLTLFLILTYLFYKIYKLLKCPPELANVPRLDLLAILKIATSKDSFDTMIDKYIGPMLEKHGIVRFLSLKGWCILVADTEASKVIFNNPEIFHKDVNLVFTSNPHASNFFGKDQITSINGEKWKILRKLINPIFHQTWPIETFAKYTREALDNWSRTNGKSVEILDNIQRLNLDILGHAIFNIDFESVKNPDSKLYNQYHTIAKEVFRSVGYFLFPILEELPYFRRPELHKLINNHDKFITDMVIKRKELECSSELENKDMLSRMLQASREDGTSLLSLNEIRDNLKTFFIAGHETTTNTLTATLYYLARYKNVQENLREEILQVLNNPKVLANPTLDQLKQMKYLNMVIKESMRIMTTAAVVERTPVTPFQLTNSIYLPVNTQVFILAWQIHKQSKYFPNPKEFNPERFRDPSSVESKNWQPFITGPRTCIGSTLALMEMRVFLVLVLQKFNFDIQPDNPDYENLRLNSTSIIHPLDLHLDLTARI